MVFSDMRDALGKPPLMVVDLRPVTYPMILISDPAIAEQVSKGTKAFPRSIPKSETEKHPAHLMGPKSVLTAQGDDWYALRQRFNPGFAPAHLLSLLPKILAPVPRFLDNLDRYAETGREFSLAFLVTGLMFDIIGRVVMDVDLQAQSLEPGGSQGELIRLYRELLLTYINDPLDLPWWLVPRTELKRRRLGRRINQLLGAIIYRKHADQRRQGKDETSRPRDILSLSLQDAPAALPPAFVDEASDQLKTFLFAGHDTTSIMLSWVFYELARTPRALAAVRAELDAVLGADTVEPQAAMARILASSTGADVVGRMAYCSAVVKETLRLHPPAGTARMTQPGTGFTLRTADGTEHGVDGAILYVCHSLVHRDPAVYGDSADLFMPERWLDVVEEDKQDGVVDPRLGEAFSSAAKRRACAPAGAWRPFERGPRNCVGQDFAKIEAYLILAVVARRYEFVKGGLGAVACDDQGQPVMGKGGQYEVSSDLYQVSVSTGTTTLP